MKRYCQTLDLYDDKELIEAYVAEHAHVCAYSGGYPFSISGDIRSVPS